MKAKELIKLLEFGAVLFFFFGWPFFRGLFQAKKGQATHRRKQATLGKGAQRRAVSRAPRAPRSHGSAKSRPVKRPAVLDAKQTTQELQAKEWQAQLARYKSLNHADSSRPAYAGPSAEYENLEGGLYSELEGGFHHHVYEPEAAIKREQAPVHLNRDAIIAAVVLGEASILKRPGVGRRQPPRVWAPTSRPPRHHVSRLPQ